MLAFLLGGLAGRLFGWLVGWLVGWLFFLPLEREMTEDAMRCDAMRWA